MDIQELRAQNYAIELLKTDIEKIKEIYKQGYEDGQKDVEGVSLIRINDEDYMNLGLASHTWWAINGYRCKYNHKDINNLNLPTLEQWKELLECKCSPKYERRNGRDEFEVEIVGPNGNIITPRWIDRPPHMFFWTKDTNESGKVELAGFYQEPKFHITTEELAETKKQYYLAQVLVIDL